MTLTLFWYLYESPWDWAAQPIEEQEGFLGELEREKLRTLRFPKRRAEWLQGRWAAKTLAQKVLPVCAGLPMTCIQVLNQSSGMPYLKIDDLSGVLSPAAQPCLSISHCGRLAFCALAFAPDFDEAVGLGADIERIEARHPLFVEDYFTPRERELIRQNPAPDRMATLLWSAKEAVLKALGTGLRLDTRQVEILEGIGKDGLDDQPFQDLRRQDAHWVPLRSNRVQYLCWLPFGDSHVLTLACRLPEGRENDPNHLSQMTRIIE